MLTTILAGIAALGSLAILISRRKDAHECRGRYNTAWFMLTFAVALVLW